MTAFTAALATYSTMPTALAQQGPKKSIYDDEESETVAPAVGTIRPATPVAQDLALTKSEIVSGVTVRTSDALEQTISKGRTWLHGKAEAGQKAADNAFEKYLNAERNVTSTIAEIKSDDEDLLPGAIYVLVSTLSGSILTRNRNFLFRGIAPIAFGAAAFAYFLPQTYENTGKLIWRFEQKAPALVEVHTQTLKHVDCLKNDVAWAVNGGKEALETGVHNARQFVADSTGLQIPSDKPKKE